MALRAAIVGAGRSGIEQARALSSLDMVEVVAVADPLRPVRDAFQRTFAPSLSVTDYRRLAADPDIDIAYICSPPATRSKIAVDFLLAGKHVVCHQPMAVTVKQADEMMTAAEQSSGRLFVSMPQRYHPASQWAAAQIEDEKIGRPFMAVAEYIVDEFDRLNDWHDWKGTWELGGGGVLMEHGPCIIDLLHYFLGPLSAVGAACTRFAIEPLTKAEDTCLLELEFESEITAQAAITGAARYNAWLPNYSGLLWRVEVFGVAGSIRISNIAPKLSISAQKIGYREMDPAELQTGLPTDVDRDILESIIEGRDPLATPGMAREALRAIAAGYKSSQMKRRVDVFEEL